MPGVASCAEYDARPEEQRQGDTSDFTSTAPYLRYAADCAGLEELLGFLYAECCTRNKAVEPTRILCCA